MRVQKKLFLIAEIHKKKNKISRNRLTAKGYGETQLVNKCADDVYCTEEEHQMNRRSEFIIVKIK